VSHDPVDPNSTYTATFDFEKAMLGAYAGRWQLLINDNLDLIDAAIAGKAAANHAHTGTYEPAIATLAVAKGGTGTGTAPTSGQVLVGTSGGIYAPATLTDGANIAITEGSGAITIASTGAPAVHTHAADTPAGRFLRDDGTWADVATAPAGSTSGTITLTPPDDPGQRYRWALDRLAEKQAAMAAFTVPPVDHAGHVNVTSNATRNVVVNSTDQTANLLYLVQNCADGATLYFPPGTYRLDGKVTIPNNKVVHFSGDEGAVFNCRYQPEGFLGVVEVNKTGSRISGMRVYGLAWDFGPRWETGNFHSAYPFDFHLCDDLAIQYCRILRTGYGLKLDGCRDVLIEHCYWEDGYYAGYGYAVGAYGDKGESANVTIRQCFFHATDLTFRTVATGTGWRHAITAGGNNPPNPIRTITITDNYIEGTTEGAIDAHDGISGPYLVDGNVFYSCDHAVHLDDSLLGGAFTRNVTIGHATLGSDGMIILRNTAGLNANLFTIANNFYYYGAYSGTPIVMEYGRHRVTNNVATGPDNDVVFASYAGTCPGVLEIYGNTYYPDLGYSGPACRTISTPNTGLASPVVAADAWTPLTVNQISDVAIVTPARGDLLYRNAAGQWANLPAGTAGQVLTIDENGDPTWSS
jgi:hypothetical protein